MANTEPLGPSGTVCQMFGFSHGEKLAGVTRGIGNGAPPSAARQRKANPEVNSPPHKRAISTVAVGMGGTPAVQWEWASGALIFASGTRMILAAAPAAESARHTALAVNAVRFRALPLCRP